MTSSVRAIGVVGVGHDAQRRRAVRHRTAAPRTASGREVHGATIRRDDDRAAGEGGVERAHGGHMARSRTASWRSSEEGPRVRPADHDHRGVHDASGDRIDDDLGEVLRMIHATFGVTVLDDRDRGVSRNSVSRRPGGETWERGHSHQHDRRHGRVCQRFEGTEREVTVSVDDVHRGCDAPMRDRDAR